MNMRPSNFGPSTAHAEKLHSQKYRLPGETFRESMSRVALALSDNNHHYNETREILLQQRFLPAGRIQSAMGAPKQVTPYNCFVSGVIPDSFVNTDNHHHSSIMHRATEAAATMRMGGGIGYDFSTLRPRGALIKKLMSQSSGPVQFMDIYNTVGLATSSAGNRRGAQMGVLRIDHPDIREFVFAKQNTERLTGFNISVAVTDEFMEALDTERPFALRFAGQNYGEVDPLELWETIMRSTWDWGEPGVLFVDTINRMNNLWYCETLATTNPCFTGDTKVWTDRGHVAFADLVGKTVNVLTESWDGKLVYRPMTNIRVTQRQARLVEVTFDNGTKVRCTPEHLFFLKGGGSTEASRLQPGVSVQSVYRYNANSKGYKRLTNGAHQPLEHHVPFEGGIPVGYDVHHIDEMKDHNWPENLQLKNCGEHISEHMRGDRNPMRRFPEKNVFKTMDFSQENNPKWRHDLDTQQMVQDREAGMSFGQIARKHGCSPYTANKRVTEANHKVVSVVELEITEDVYCGSVDEFSRFFVALGKDDGVLVHNCGEQPLPPFGACLLGSWNLVKYLTPQTSMGVGPRWSIDLDQLVADVPVIVRAMDNVVDRALYPLPEQEHEAKSKRRMGLGVTGLANALEAMGHPYGTESFLQWEAKIKKAITRAAYAASVQLAREKGAFSLFDALRYTDSRFVRTLDDELQADIYRYGIRNSHLISDAPTGTISQTADNISSSNEPVYQYRQVRTQNLDEGRVDVEIYDYGFQFLGVRGRRAAAGEVSPDQHVDVLVTAQEHVDSAVSKTVNTDGNVSWDDFKGLYTKAHLGGAKGCATFNKDGKRASLFKHDFDEPSDLPFPTAAPQGIMALVGAEEFAQSCSWDPSTGRRSCE